MSHRWTCPECSDTILAPSRMRHDDPRRFCLSCSAGKPRLVERTCPALEAERAEKQEAINTRRARGRENRKRGKAVQAARVLASEQRFGLNLDALASKLAYGANRLARGEVDGEIRMEADPGAIRPALVRARDMRNSDPAWVIAQGIDFAAGQCTRAQYMIRSPVHGALIARFPFEVAEAMYGVRATGKSPSQSVGSRLYPGLRDLITKVHPLHRMLVLVYERIGCALPKDPLLGAWLDQLPGALWNDYLHVELPTLNEALAASGMDGTKRVFTELLVPMPSTTVEP